MSQHQVEFEYKLQEWGTMNMDIDPALDYKEAEAAALVQIKEDYNDISDIEITSIKEI